MSVNKKICLVGVALVLLLAGVFAWHKGLPPFDDRHNAAEEQAASADPAQPEAGHDKAGKSESGKDESGKIESGKAGQHPQQEPEKVSGQPVERAEGDKSDEESDANPKKQDNASSDEEGAAPGEAVVRGTVERATLLSKCSPGRTARPRRNT